MTEKVSSLKKSARLAGILYLLLGLVSPYGLIYVPSIIMVNGDPAATAGNILAHEFLFRSGAAANIVGQVVYLLLVLVLYRLLKDVNKLHASIMVGFVIVAVPIGFLTEVFKIAAVMILDGSYRPSFPKEQIDYLVTLLLNIGNYGTQMLQLYWGLWLFPFGWLVYKSGFIPWIFGILLIFNGLGYVVLSFTFQLYPEYLTQAGNIVAPLLFIGEIPIIFWFLIKGTKSNVPNSS